MRIGFSNSFSRGAIAQSGVIDSAPVPAPAPPVITWVPVLSGTPRAGETLSVATASVTGNPSPVRALQWLRNGAAIPGATTVSYAVQATDVGAVLSVRQTETNSVGSVSVNSAALGPVEAAFTAPVISEIPVISGSEVVGAVLTASPADVIANPTSVTTWQWIRSGAPIAGAVSDGYTLAAADAGETLTVLQTETNSQGTDTVESSPTAVIGPALTSPVITGAPTVSGPGIVGQTLLATAANATGNPAPTTSWQWLRSGIAIAGATSDTYTLVASDAGETLTVVQTETNGEGAASVQSAATGPIGLDSAAPVIADTSYDDSIKTATFSTTEGGTLHWAIYSNASGAPTLNSNGTWAGTTIETGSETVPTSGSGSLLPEYTAAIGDRLIYGIIDGDNAVSNLITETFTPAASSFAPTFVADEFVNVGNLSSFDLISGVSVEAGKTYAILVTGIYQTGSSGEYNAASLGSDSATREASFNTGTNRMCGAIYTVTATATGTVAFSIDSTVGGNMKDTSGAIWDISGGQYKSSSGFRFASVTGPDFDVDVVDGEFVAMAAATNHTGTGEGIFTTSPALTSRGTFPDGVSSEFGIRAGFADEAVSATETGRDYFINVANGETVANSAGIVAVFEEVS